VTKKIAILISGEGSTLQAFIDAQNAQKLQGEIVLVISNRPTANGLSRAKSANIPSISLDHQLFENRESFDIALADTIDQYKPDLIILAGFMRILSSFFVTKYQSKLVNIHPSLLPKYTGLNTHKRVLQAKESEHGCSIHFVTEQLDGGPVFAQAKIKVCQQDTETSLANKVHQLEHQLYIKSANLLLTGKLQLKNSLVYLNNEPMDDYIEL